jgi:hypothetical protein
MICALAHHRIEGSMKGKKRKQKVLVDEYIPVQIDDIIGAGSGRVKRGSTIKLALPYGEASISSSCTITVSCYEDEATIRAVAQKAMSLVTDILEGDGEYMVKFLDKAGA